jgi:hypothetical protein
MRATRDLLRRRLPRLRPQAGLLAHLHNTTSPSTRSPLGKQLAYHANRGGVAERVPAPAVPKSLDVDRTRIGSYDRLRTA